MGNTIPDNGGKGKKMEVAIGIQIKDKTIWGLGKMDQRMEWDAIMKKMEENTRDNFKISSNMEQVEKNFQMETITMAHFMKAKLLVREHINGKKGLFTLETSWRAQNMEMGF